MENNPIQAELDKIEADASARTQAILAQQDEYLRALALVGQLKATLPHSPAADDIEVRLCYYDTDRRYGFNVYSTKRHDGPDFLRAAISVLGLPVQISDGYDHTNRCWHIEGYPDVKLFMPADMTPIAQALPEAA